MPAKNAIKTYVEGGYYHLYNRGVEKRKIFLDAEDNSVFLSYLKEYLSVKDTVKLQQKLADENTSYKDKDKILKLIRLNNFNKDIELLAFCLMPNHFHLLLRQSSENSIDRFMNSLCTRYTMYFNKKYRRVGSLFQGVYKAVLVEDEKYLVYLTKYLHSQALLKKGSRPSSYASYLGRQNLGWINSSLILSYFSKINRNLSYESFISFSDNTYLDLISRLLLD